VVAPDKPGSTAQIDIDCHTESQHADFSLKLRPGSKSSSRWKMAQFVKPPILRVRPPLTAEETETLSNNELSQRGYPPRPDKAVSPAAYSDWRQWVMKPVEIVSPHLVQLGHIRADIARGVRIHRASCSGGACPAEFDNWSGFVQSNAGDVRLVSGWWRLPWVSPLDSLGWDQVDYESTWVGIDGFNLSDLAQGGTTAQAYYINWSSGGHKPMVFYSAWTELLPAQPVSQVINNMLVTNNDLVP
jgi:hypothetical protein